jgi:hypothetical protein
MQENTTGQGGQQKPSLSWTQPNDKNVANQSNQPNQPKAPQPVAKPAAVHTPTMSAAAPSNTGTYVGIFVAGVIVGALIGWGFTSSNGTSGMASSTTETTNTSTTTSTGTSANTTGTSQTGVNLSGSSVGSSGAIVLASNQTAGFGVAVTKITVSQPTWLVVYEDNAGTPGKAIGAGLFFPESTSGTIELLRATMPGQSYFVGQSLDDGDKIFSTQNDKPVRDSKGNPLFTQFTAK